jgi:hypothetical protein
MEEVTDLSGTCAVGCLEGLRKIMRDQQGNTVAQTQLHEITPSNASACANLLCFRKPEPASEDCMGPFVYLLQSIKKFCNRFGGGGEEGERRWWP